MSGFLYFLPGVGGNPREHLTAFGLEHIADKDEKLHSRDIIQGVDGQRGLLVANSLSWPNADEVRFTEELKWHRFPKSHAEKQACVSYTSLPTPTDLVRRETIGGEWVRLGDGQMWLVPIARKVTESGTMCNLPLCCGLDEETGELTYDQVALRYRPIWDHVTHYQNALSEAVQATPAGENISFSYEIPSLEKFYADVFGCNYRVSLRELTLLGVITTGGLLSQLLAVLTDDAGWERLKKKPDQDTGSGSSGI